MLHSLCRTLSSLFGLGFLPKMPGTWGTLGAFFCAYCIGKFLGKTSSSVWLYLTLFTTFLGLYTSHCVLKYTNFQEADPSWIVIDEAAGSFLTLYLVSLYISIDFKILVIAFVFFRIFDMFKPWPINWIERVSSYEPSSMAFGIMADDLMAAVFAAIFTLFSCRVLG
jgi:phosphatidylglycerophosphatase A